MNKCQNPECGKMFEPTKGHLDQKYCCRICNHRAYYLMNHIDKRKPKPKGNFPFGADRPLTRTTVYLVHKWFAEGMTLTEIARLTNRNIERVVRAYRIPLTEMEKVRLETYKR